MSDTRPSVMIATLYLHDGATIEAADRRNDLGIVAVHLFNDDDRALAGMHLSEAAARRMVAALTEALAPQAGDEVRRLAESVNAHNASRRG